MSGLADSRDFLVGDFETTTDPDDCRVWLWALADIRTRDVEIGTDILKFLQSLSQRDSYVWFHNLAFDGSFIIDWLLNNGYEWTDSQKPGPQQFTTVISFMGKFYSISITFGNGAKCELRDSLKKLPMGVAAVSKTFNLEDAKGVIDYDAYRPIGYEPTADELEYVRKDVLIIADALRIQIASGLTALTVGSDALNEYKSIMGKSFKNLFPVLPAETDSEIRRAYRGGFTYADPRFSGRILGAGCVFDVNSLYPSVMYSQVLPHGFPVFLEGAPREIPDYPLWITSVTMTARLKKDHIPCIQIKNSSAFSATEYLREIDEPVTVACTNIDFALWIEHYDIDIESFNGTYYFQGASGMFNAYIDKWSAIKEQSVGGMRTIAKLQLNSLYGKFATNPNVTPKIPILDEKGIVRLVIGEEETREPVYTAMGVFITSYARNYTIRSAQSHYDRFAYADTDSLHLVGIEPVNLDIHPTRMGAWKHEYNFTEALFARAKAYTERHENGELETHIAGLPKAAANQVTFEHYLTGHSFGGKLSPKRVPGGIVLTDVGFTLNKTGEN